MKTAHQLLAESEALEKSILSQQAPLPPADPPQTETEEEAATEDAEESADAEDVEQVTADEQKTELEELPSDEMEMDGLDAVPDVQIDASEATDVPNVESATEELPEPDMDELAKADEAISAWQDLEEPQTEELSEVPEMDTDTESVADVPDISVPASETSDVTVEQQDTPDPPEAIEQSTQDVDVADAETPEIEQAEVPDPPEVTFDAPGESALPENEPTGFQGLTELPAITAQQMKLDELDDPTIDHEERVNRQFEIQQKANDDLVKRLATELGPQFDNMREYQMQVVHNYVDEQALLNTLLRPRG